MARTLFLSPIMGNQAVLYSLFSVEYNQNLTQAVMVLLLCLSAWQFRVFLIQVLNAAKGFDTSQDFLQGQSQLCMAWVPTSFLSAVNRYMKQNLISSSSFPSYVCQMALFNVYSLDWLLDWFFSSTFAICWSKQLNDTLTFQSHGIDSFLLSTWHPK